MTWGQFLSQAATWLQMVCNPRGLDPRKQLLLGSSSNSWDHRSSLHKLNARNQWVPLCLHVRFYYARFMPLHVLGTESWGK